MSRKPSFVLALAALCLTTSSTAEPTPRVVPGGSVQAIPFPGHDVTELADHTTTAGGAAVLELRVPPKTFGAPPHTHANEDEHFYVIEGEIEFLDREDTIKAGAGSLVVLPRGHLHGFWNDSDKPARLLLIVTPGEFASFFDQVVARIRANPPADGKAMGQLIGQVAATHDVQVFPEKVPEGARHLLAD